MSLNLSMDNPVAPHEDGDDNYVDPILFAEGIYAGQTEYESTIDTFADRINKGEAVPRGRETKNTSKPDITIDSKVLVKVVGELEPSLRSAFTLYYGQEYSYKQIAEALDVTPGAARARVHAATKQVTKAISDSAINSALANVSLVNINLVKYEDDEPLRKVYFFIANQIKNFSIEG